MKSLSPFYDTFAVAIRNCWPMLGLFVVIMIVLRLTKVFTSHEKFIFYKEFYSLLAILYFLLLYYLLLTTEGASSGFNIIPFTEMTRYTIGSKSFFYNVIGNIVLFMPFGYIVSNYLNSKNTFQILIITSIISLTAESIQYHIGRAFDIDDIILNVVGSVVGFLIYIILKDIRKHLPSFLQNTLFYNIIAILVFIGIVLLFCSIWGIKI